ncbi:site-2 protease family protein [Halarsenatibacter silvermanii]|uniref:Zn-dependent protease (Includes SpoIVFB) n=1 Tax=Halarsenatibacter silvermanii TaxID=321763 RepID=A0A1G9PIN6_9FIRM|nr:site-2 protease family protein [Halarsenatibacter silvermanii]SDL98574.1 Zn-dependent protease (includes SpoIVFB) [Halarsenatibacter silvermanii]
MNMIFELILVIPILLLSLSIHEFSHGMASYKKGDPTPKMQGRLTLNPLSHLDPMGALVLLLTRRFGWAKPVPINPRYYSNPRRDMMVVSVAGPASNFALALIFALALNLVGIFASGPLAMRMYGQSGGLLMITVQFLYLAVIINVSLGIFNLLPVPPLDGSKILRGVLPPSYDRYLNQLEGPLGMMLLLVLAFTGILGAIIGPIVQMVLGLMVFV